MRSRPIIEDTSRVRFAPLVPIGGFPGAKTALRAAGLTDAPEDAAAWRDAWRGVDDFAWIRSTHSPNWAELPPAERAPPPRPPPPGADEAAAEEACSDEDAAAAAADADEL